MMIITQPVEDVPVSRFSYPEPKRRQRSLTNSQVERSDAERIIKTRFHGRHQIANFEEFGHGLFGSQYLITLDDDSRLILRVAPPSDVRVLQHERDVLPGDYEVLELIRQNAPDVPIPDVLLHSKSPSALLDLPFSLISFIPGVTLDLVRHDLPAELLSTIDYDLGLQMHRISQIHNSHFGLAGPTKAKMYTTWRDAFLSMFESVLRDAEDLFVSVPYEVLRWHVGRLAYALEDVKVPQLVCYDMCDAHVVVDELNGRLNGLFDFERAVWGDPLMDPAFRDPSPAFLRGYGEAAGGDPLALGGNSARARVLLYTLHHYLRAVVEVYYRRLNHDLEFTARKGLVRALKSLTEFRP